MESIGTAKKIRKEFDFILQQRVAEISDRAEMQISKLREELDNKLNEIQTEKSEKMDVLTNEQNGLLDRLDDILVLIGTVCYKGVGHT